MDTSGTEVDTDDENPPDEMATLPLRRAVRHRCSLRNCIGAHISSHITRRSSPASLYRRYADSNHNPDAEDRPAHEEEIAALVSAVEDRRHTETPLRHRQLERLTTEKIAVSSQKLFEAASTPLTASEAVRAPPIMEPVSATQNPYSSAAQVYSSTPPSPSPSVYFTSPAYSLSYTSSLIPFSVYAASLATHSPSAYFSSQTPSSTVYDTSIIPSLTARTTSRIPSPIANSANLPPCSVPHFLCPRATRDSAPASDFHTADKVPFVPPFNTTTTCIPSTPVPFTTPSSHSAPSTAPSSHGAPSTSTPQLIPRSPNTSSRLGCVSPADSHHTHLGSDHRTLHAARPPHSSGLPRGCGALALSHVPYSTRRTRIENSKYEYITSYEFLRRVHDLALVMASQRLSLRYLQNLASPARCLIQGRLLKWFRCIKSPGSREITPVFRQYCKKFIVAMLCPRQAPSKVITVATMVDTVEKRAYADDPNSKMYYCWQLATALCLILEELGSIGRAR